MISKELLSGVLDVNVEYVELGSNRVEFYLKDPQLRGGGMYDDINIYELAHKCKEWALDNGFVLSSELFVIEAICEINDGETYERFL